MQNQLSLSLRRIAIVAAATAAVAAQAAPWTSVGSAGVVDEADQSIYSFVNNEARLTAAAPVGSVLNLRYNMVALEGFSGLNQAIWTVRYVDTGAASRVQLTLRQFNLASGLSSTIATFDSDDYASAPGYQTRSLCLAPDWDFEDGPFYIEATMTKSAAGGGIAPGLGGMKIVNGNCIP